MRHVRLRLEDRPHQRRQPGVEPEHLLELVEDERDAAPALRGELRRELEQPLERRVHVLLRVARREAEAERAGVRVDGHHRPHAQAAEDVDRALADALERRRQLLVERLRELRGELLFRRRAHEVDLRDENLVTAHELLRRAPDQRGLPVATRREDDDVLTVEDVGLELPKLVVAVGEALVEGEIAEVEGIRRSRGHLFAHLRIAV